MSTIAGAVTENRLRRPRSEAGATVKMMRAARICAPRELEIVNVPAPQPDASQLLVRLQGCGVCASNIPPWEGKPWFNYPMEPGAPGHEGWGRIEKIGDNVTGFSVGEHVGLLSYHGYAEYDVCDLLSVVKLPSALNARSFPPEPLGCAMNIFARSDINRNDVVAIVGIGFLGALLTQLAHAVGARVIAISRSEFALNVAETMGASYTVALDEPSRVLGEVENLTNRRFCDVVIECTGKQQPLNLASELTRERGRLVIAGYHQDGPRQINMQLWNWRGLDVINAHERDPNIYRVGMTRAVRAVEGGLLDPTPLFTHTFPLEQLADALDMAAARPRGFMKALVLMP